MQVDGDIVPLIVNSIWSVRRVSSVVTAQYCTRAFSTQYCPCLQYAASSCKLSLPRPQTPAVCRKGPTYSVTSLQCGAQVYNYAYFHFLGRHNLISLAVGFRSQLTTAYLLLQGDVGSLISYMSKSCEFSVVIAKVTQVIPYRDHLFLLCTLRSSWKSKILST